MNRRAWKRLRTRFPKVVAFSIAVLLLLRPIVGAIAVSATTPPILTQQPTAPTPSKTPASATPKPDSDASPNPASEKPANPEQKPDETTKEPVKPSELVKTPEQVERYKKLAEADRLYRAGDKAGAEKLYREVKPPFKGVPETQAQPEAITDLEQLSPAGKVYWRESEAGLTHNLESRTFVPLELLTQKYPQFIPGQLRYAEALEKYGKKEQALSVLDRAATLFPNQPELVQARVAALEKNEKWIDASIAARQFALINPNHPQAAKFTTVAEEDFKRYKSQLRRRLRGNLVGNIITGALGYALTGDLFGPLSAVQNTVLLLKGESAVGERVAKQAKRQLDLVKDKEVNDYVNEVGQKLANAAGRKEFKYEFQIVLDDQLNAFALPGGKVFVNAGAIVQTQSEAELAGLLGHELSHAVLSHAFQLITEGTLTANLTQFIPYVGGLIGDISTLSYSRDMERQADILGTRLLALADYAADGLLNLTVTLEKQEEEKRKPMPPAWLTTHPLTRERVGYLEKLITTTGYNRYAYEGVERHAAIQTKVETLLKEYKAQEKKRRRR